MGIAAEQRGVGDREDAVGINPFDLFEEVVELRDLLDPRDLNSWSSRVDRPGVGLLCSAKTFESCLVLGFGKIRRRQSPSLPNVRRTPHVLTFGPAKETQPSHPPTTPTFCGVRLL